MRLPYRTLWKDTWRSLLKSKGRFFSIMILLAIGSFALVGLKVTPPDMRYTAQHYFDAHYLADMQVMSTMGLDQHDCDLIRTTQGVSRASCGYFTDVTLNTSNTAVRIFSSDSRISTYELVSGRMPRAHSTSEIAVSNQLSNNYKLGDALEVKEANNNSILRHKRLKIVGFVHSVELISTINLGQSAVGTGTLDGYGVVSAAAFHSEYYTLARVRFKDLHGVDPYSTTYTHRLREHKKQISKAFAHRGAQRLEDIRSEATAQLDDAQKEIDSAAATLSENQHSLDDAQNQVHAAQQELQDSENKMNQGFEQLNLAASQLDATYAQLEAQRNSLEEARSRLIAAQQQIDATYEHIQQARKSGAPESTLAPQEEQLHIAQTHLNNQRGAYDAGLAQYEQGVAQYEQALSTYSSQLATLEQSRSRLQQARQELNARQEQLTQSYTQLEEGRQRLAQEQHKLDNARSDTHTQLQALTEPTYSFYGRHDWPGHDGYTVYASSPRTIDAVSNIYTVFLFLVAAMVTIATMSRFVDEERTNAGTMKALGYSQGAVLLKFLVYGTLASVSGSILGIVLGHVLLPHVIYAAHSDRFTLPDLDLHYDVIISMISLVSAIACATLPAWFVCYRELREKPSTLLLPKPPAAGSTIMLERIPLLWNRLSFTYKVTVRNIFRYKDRMFMTICGVAVASALLFAGLGLQSSINSINSRQYGDLVHYDLIVSQSAHTSSADAHALTQYLHSSAVTASSSVHFETVSKIAGAHDESQSIALIVPKKPEQLRNFVSLISPSSRQPIELNNSGAVISERLAKLTTCQPGDTLEFKDADGRERSVRIAGISEMYMGHFMYMTPATYARVFHTTYSDNGYLVTLKNHDYSSIERHAAHLTQLPAVAAVVQNIALSSAMDSIAQSLNKVMFVLVVVSMLLTFCILYNLTNINVSERIRELSTVKVLGFFNGEVTLYIYRETIILSLLGTLLGFGLGKALHSYMLEVVPPSNTMFYPGTGIWAYIIPTVAITVSLAILAAYVHHRLRTVDMLESLKAVE